MGCVLRDIQGEFIGCHSAKIYGVLSSRDAEVYDLRQAIIWVLRLEFPSAVFELDAKMVVLAIMCSWVPLSILKYIYNMCSWVPLSILKYIYNKYNLL